jgi:hypothetical protein
MASPPFVPNNEEYYLQERHSDVAISITDETAAPGDAALARRLPGHSMVLVAFSSYCKAKVVYLRLEELHRLTNGADHRAKPSKILT